MKKTARVIVWGIVLAGVAVAADWSQFCGPTRDNISTETGLARSWPAEGPQVLWAADVTTGYAGPSIRDGKVYVMDYEDGVSSLRCLSFESGKELWRVKFDDPGELTSKKYEGTRGTPTVTEDSLYAVTLHGTVFCVDLKSQKMMWSKNMQRDYGKISAAWGFAQSPLLVGDLVIFAPLTESHGVMAMDPKSGEVVWMNNDYFGGGWTSPALIKMDGEDQILVVAGGEKPKKKSSRRKSEDAEEAPAEPKALRPTVVFALSPMNGKVLWDYEEWSCFNPIPNPVMTGNDTLFISSGYKSVSTYIQIKGNKVKELWETEDAATWIEQPIFVNDHLFVGGTTKKPSKGLVCINLDGEVQWDTNQIDGAPSFEHLNMLAADGMLIGLDGNSGILHLIAANPKKFNELASAKVVAEKGQTWAPIALSDGKLLVRDHTQIKCLNLK